jgi:hydroxyacylglutathione hydrolase
VSGKPTSTIGFEKRYNKAFRIEDQTAFLSEMLADIPPAPPQAAQVRAFNSGLMAAE